MVKVASAVVAPVPAVVVPVNERLNDRRVLAPETPVVPRAVLVRDPGVVPRPVLVWDPAVVPRAELVPVTRWGVVDLGAPVVDEPDFKQH